MITQLAHLALFYIIHRAVMSMSAVAAVDIWGVIRTFSGALSDDGPYI